MCESKGHRPRGGITNDCFDYRICWCWCTFDYGIHSMYKIKKSTLGRDYSHTYSDWTNIYFCKWQNPIYNKKSVSLCSSEYTVFWRLGNRQGAFLQAYRMVRQGKATKTAGKEKRTNSGSISASVLFRSYSAFRGVFSIACAQCSPVPDFSVFYFRNLGLNQRQNY